MSIDSHGTQKHQKNLDNTKGRIDGRMCCGLNKILALVQFLLQVDVVLTSKVVGGMTIGGSPIAGLLHYPLYVEDYIGT